MHVFTKNFHHLYRDALRKENAVKHHYIRVHTILLVNNGMGVREGKNWGGRKKFARLFRIVPDYSPKKFFSANPPPLPPPVAKKISDSVPF